MTSSLTATKAKNRVSHCGKQDGFAVATAYPNPGKDVLNIRTGLKDAWVEVYDILFSAIFSWDFISA